MEPLLISKFCIVTCLGAGLEATVTALRESRSGLSPCSFAGANISTYVGEIPEVDTFRLDADLEAYDCRNNRLAGMALAQDEFSDAVAAARDRYGPGRIGVFLGTSTSGLLHTEAAYRNRDPQTGALPADFDFARTHSTFSIADFVARQLRLEGPAVVISAACASTAKVFGVASRMIESGFCDAAIVGGADSLCHTTLHGFRSLELTSAGPCRPFDEARDGISIGEAAGFVLLEKSTGRSHADEVLRLGVGESSDAHHMSSPHPEGLGARLAMERALTSAALEPQDIDYINLHGTATPAGDAAEDRAVQDLFGTDTPCSSIKGQTGHTLGAAGVVDAVASVLSIVHGFMPGSPHTRNVDPKLKSRYLVERQLATVDRVLSNSFGFGGSNCSLIFGRMTP